MVIGVTGGVGSGKTTVLKLLERRYNAHVYIADDFGHEALKKGNPCYEKIVEKFGYSIIKEDENLNSKELASIVFRNPDKLKVLNEIIHPYVWERIEHERKKHSEEELVVIESAILVEAGYGKICDQIWGVFATKEKRQKRLLESRGYTKEKSKSIMEAQMEWEKIEKHCDKVIQNDGEIQDLEKQLEKTLGIDEKVWYDID